MSLRMVPNTTLITTLITTLSVTLITTLAPRSSLEDQLEFPDFPAADCT